MTKTDRLTHVEEIELVRHYQRATSNTTKKVYLDKLVMANVGLVHKLVHKFPMKNATCSYDDLFQEGIAGLIHGISKFDTTRGYRLSTYVYRWIHAYVRRYYQNHARNVRVPVHLSDEQARIAKVIERMTFEMGRTPTKAEIREVVPNLDKVMSAMTTQISLNSVLGEDGELVDIVGDDTEVTQFESTHDADTLMDHLSTQVSQRDVDIIRARYGLDGNGGLTLTEIAEQTDLTRARVHQVEKKCLRLMKESV